MAYVYRHIRLDKNVPFYIGIGENKYRHSTKWGRNIIWRRITAKTGYEVEVLFDDISWEFACQKEIEFIKLYGKINNNTGCLANMTDGGDGNLGLKHSEEAIRKIGESSKGRPGYWKGRKLPPESVKASADKRRGKPNLKKRGIKNPAQSERIKISNIGNTHHLGHTHSEESKKKMSEGMKGRIGHNRRAVLQFTLSGDFVKEYVSAADAKFQTGAHDVSAVCRGERNYSKGYLWKYK